MLDASRILAALHKSFMILCGTTLSPALLKKSIGREAGIFAILLFEHHLRCHIIDPIRPNGGNLQRMKSATEVNVFSTMSADIYVMFIHEIIVKEKMTYFGDIFACHVNCNRPTNRVSEYYLAWFKYQ